jgi:hypothetical protein
MAMMTEGKMNENQEVRRAREREQIGDVLWEIVSI